MDSIFENPLARMYGPAFLLFYVLLYILAAIYLFYIAPKLAAKVPEDPYQALPGNPDVYELAYLRGAENEVVALLIYTLLRKEYFVFQTENKKTSLHITRNEKHQQNAVLPEIEKDALEELDKPKAIDAFAKKLSHCSKFLHHCANIKNKLEKDSFLWSSKEAEQFGRMKLFTIALLVALGLYKVSAALSHGHNNVIILIIIAIAGSLILNKMQVKEIPTSKGRARLKNFKEMFKPVQGPPLLFQPLYLQQTLLALYGFYLLESSSMNNFYHLVAGQLEARKGVYLESDSFTFSSSSGCSSGSSCSGGSGCGGGCGGCGGCS